MLLGGWNEDLNDEGNCDIDVGGGGCVFRVYSDDTDDDVHGNDVGWRLWRCW